MVKSSAAIIDHKAFLKVESLSAASVFIQGNPIRLIDAINCRLLGADGGL